MAQTHLGTMTYISTLGMLDLPSAELGKTEGFVFFKPIVGMPNYPSATHFYMPGFYMSKSEQYGMGRISICGSVGCTQCNSQLTGCLQCANQAPLIRDSVFNDMTCLTTCRQPTI